MTSLATIKTGWVSRRLNGLIEQLKDREAAFANAARRTDKPKLERALTEFAQERARFASDLQGEVVRLGALPEESGTITGALRRGFANLASEFTGDDVRPEYGECHLVEFFAWRSYEELLSARDLPTGLPSLLKTQRKRTEVALGFLRRLARVQDKKPPPEAWIG